MREDLPQLYILAMEANIGESYTSMHSADPAQISGHIFNGLKAESVGLATLPLYP